MEELRSSSSVRNSMSSNIKNDFSVLTPSFRLCSRLYSECLLARLRDQMSNYERCGQLPALSGRVVMRRTIVIIEPRDLDIRCGRGESIKQMPGNILMRDIVRFLKPMFVYQTKQENREMAEHIVAVLAQRFSCLFWEVMPPPTKNTNDSTRGTNTVADADSGAAGYEKDGGEGNDSKDAPEVGLGIDDQLECRPLRVAPFKTAVNKILQRFRDDSIVNTTYQDDHCQDNDEEQQQEESPQDRAAAVMKLTERPAYLQSLDAVLSIFGSMFPNGVPITDPDQRARVGDALKSIYGETRIPSTVTKNDNKKGDHDEEGWEEQRIPTPVLSSSVKRTSLEKENGDDDEDVNSRSSDDGCNRSDERMEGDNDLLLSKDDTFEVSDALADDNDDDNGKNHDHHGSERQQQSLEEESPTGKKRTMTFWPQQDKVKDNDSTSSIYPDQKRARVRTEKPRFDNDPDSEIPLQVRSQSQCSTSKSGKHRDGTHVNGQRGKRQQNDVSRTIHFTGHIDSTPSEEADIKAEENDNNPASCFVENDDNSHRSSAKEDYHSPHVSSIGDVAPLMPIVDRWMDRFYHPEWYTFQELLATMDEHYYDPYSASC